MPLPPFGFFLAALFLLGLIITIRSRKPSITRPCEHCGSTKMTQIHHETLRTRTVDKQNGTFLPGADIRLELEQDLTYRCGQCNRTSTFRVVNTP